MIYSVISKTTFNKREKLNASRLPPTQNKKKPIDHQGPFFSFNAVQNIEAEDQKKRGVQHHKPNK